MAAKMFAIMHDDDGEFKGLNKPKFDDDDDEAQFDCEYAARCELS